ncbi:hypothetical protein NMG60_11004440 [Bertholletia excelsa]
MAFTSLQVCMDSLDWLQGANSDNIGMDSSSPSGEILGMAAERAVPRPQHEQALKCPRCESTHTKFCYYNNYSLSQPRYFCKSCRRYWTKGGNLRNIPVGGGCRKNKKPTPKKSSDQPSPTVQLPPSSSSHGPSPLLHLSDLPNGIMPVDFMGSGDFGVMSAQNFHALCSPFGMALGGNASSGSFMDPCQRLMLPYEANENASDVKPNNRVLSVEWQDPGVRSWNAGLMNGYGSSTSYPSI